METMTKKLGEEEPKTPLHQMQIVYSRMQLSCPSFSCNIIIPHEKVAAIFSRVKGITVPSCEHIII
jgi:hypothetical protein